MKHANIGKLISGAGVGIALLISSAGIALAQTSTPTTGTTNTAITASTTTGTATTTTGSATTGPQTPGIPNTGAGGDATATLLILGVSALVVLGGGLYLARQRFTAR